MNEWSCDRVMLHSSFVACQDEKVIAVDSLGTRCETFVCSEYKKLVSSLKTAHHLTLPSSVTFTCFRLLTLLHVPNVY